MQVQESWPESITGGKKHSGQDQLRWINSQDTNGQIQKESIKLDKRTRTYEEKVVKKKLSSSNLNGSSARWRNVKSYISEK